MVRLTSEESGSGGCDIGVIGKALAWLAGAKCTGRCTRHAHGAIRSGEVGPVTANLARAIPEVEPL